VVAQLNPALRGGGASARSHDVAGVDFPLSVWGYDRPAVDAYLEDVQRLVDALRASDFARTRCVARSMRGRGDDRGQGAYDAADEITVRS